MLRIQVSKCTLAMATSSKSLKRFQKYNWLEILMMQHRPLIGYKLKL